MIGLYLKNADRVVAIGDTMRLRLEEKGAPADRIRVIPNWVDTDAITPQPRDNSWARLNNLTDEFVVMHSGNIGHAQNLEMLVRATTFLRDLDDLRIVIIGGGARYLDLVHLAERLEADKLRSLPYQARDVLPHVALQRGHPFRRAGRRALGLRRAESALRDHGRRSPGRRRRRRR